MVDAYSTTREYKREYSRKWRAKHPNYYKGKYDKEKETRRAHLEPWCTIWANWVYRSLVHAEYKCCPREEERTTDEGYL